MSILGYTPNFKFRLIDFFSAPWHDDEYANWRQIDAIMAQFIPITGIVGVWENSTAYIVGNRLIDDTDGTVWECEVNHTSAASGNFAADRVANPTYWTQVTGLSTTWNDITGKPTTLTGYGITDVYTDGEVDVLLAAKADVAHTHTFASLTAKPTSIAGYGIVDAFTKVETQAGAYLWSEAGGTVDAITGSYSPTVSALVDGMRLRVRALGANTVTTPSFTPNDGVIASRTIKKYNGQALNVGDIAGDEHDLDLTYVATGTYWNLNNPATPGTAGVFATMAISQTLALTGTITPTQLSASVNDYAPTGHATASVWRVSSNAIWTITGIAGGADGRILVLYNTGSFRIDIADESVSSTATNRILTLGSNWTYLDPGAVMVLIYDNTSFRWRTLVTSTIAASNATMESGASTTSFVTPGAQRRHPAHPKFFAFVTVAAGVPSLSVSHNITSITDTGVGLLTVTIDTNFSGANWACFPAVEKDTTTTNASNSNIKAVVQSGSRTNTAVVIECTYEASDSGGGGNTPGLYDPASWSVLGLGDQ